MAVRPPQCMHSIASVVHIWQIQTELFAVWCTVFYNDFPTVEPQPTADSAREVGEGMLDVLGWRFAREGKKALPYDECFNVLGVSMDLRTSCDGMVAICNKADRVESLLQTVNGILDEWMNRRFQIR